MTKFQNPEQTLPAPQVKICGLTRVDEARACAELGADAIGCVFYPKSPRHVTDDQARAICRALPASVQRVGVFVDAPFSTIMAAATGCGLTAVQLHGRESPALVARLADAGLPVIKALWIDGAPSLAAASDYPAAALLVEGRRGRLPGGNAIAWNWQDAAPLARRRPVMVAGGLSPETVLQAARQSQAAAVDVSSGVESRPGRKDLGRVRAFLARVALHQPEHQLRRIF